MPTTPADTQGNSCPVYDAPNLSMVSASECPGQQLAGLPSNFKEYVWNKRNVFVYDVHDQVIAGVHQLGRFRVSQFYRWLAFILKIDVAWLLYSITKGLTLERDDSDNLELGSYYIVDER